MKFDIYICSKCGRCNRLVRGTDPSNHQCKFTPIDTGVACGGRLRVMSHAEKRQEVDRWFRYSRGLPTDEAA